MKFSINECTATRPYSQNSTINERPYCAHIDLILVIRRIPYALIRKKLKELVGIIHLRYGEVRINVLSCACRVLLSWYPGIHQALVEPRCSMVSVGSHHQAMH